MRLASLWCVLVPSIAHATVASSLDLAGLVQSADAVVVGRVEAQHPRWSRAHDFIVTEVTVRLSESWKGAAQPGAAVVVLREGGELDGVGMRVAGAARFRNGEEVLLFLQRRGGGIWTVGMSQGALHVDDAAGRRIVQRDLAGLTLIGAGASDEPGIRPLDALRDDVMSLARRGPTRSADDGWSSRAAPTAELPSHRSTNVRAKGRAPDRTNVRAERAPDRTNVRLERAPDRTNVRAERAPDRTNVRAERAPDRTNVRAERSPFRTNVRLDDAGSRGERNPPSTELRAGGR